MRLNRGTLLFIAACIIIIGAAVVINQVNAPGEGAATETIDIEATAAAAAGGPLFEGLTAADIQRLEIRQNPAEADADPTNEATPEVAPATTAEPTVGGVVVIEQNAEVSSSDADPAVTPEAAATDEAAPLAVTWTITEATSATDRATDQAGAQAAVNSFVALSSSESFTPESAEDLAAFGLATPAYTLTASDTEGETYTIEVGSRTPTEPSYYALVNGDQATVYLISATFLDALTLLVSTPPYVPAATATPLPSPTLNPISEVEAATLTAQAPPLSPEFTVEPVVPAVTPAPEAGSVNPLVGGGIGGAVGGNAATPEATEQ